MFEPSARNNGIVGDRWALENEKLSMQCLMLFKH